MPPNNKAIANFRSERLRERYPEIAREVGKLIADYSVEAVSRLKELAEGILVEGVDRKGEPKVYIVPPSLRANEILVTMLIGAPPQAASPEQERLTVAQAVEIEQRVLAGVPQAQARELNSRAEIKEIEGRMWPRKYMTEDEVRTLIHNLARAVNQPLLMMTKDQFELIAPGVTDSSESLERLKGFLGRGEAEIIAEVFADHERIEE